MPTSETPPPTIEERIDLLHRQLEKLQQGIWVHEQLHALSRRLDEHEREDKELGLQLLAVHDRIDHVERRLEQLARLADADI
jgi:predicted  nucleic acid-binding Zn-ribbon protein